MSQKGRPLDSQKMALVSPIHISSGDFGGCHVSRHAISSEICGQVGLAAAMRFLSVSWARKPSILRSSTGRSFRSQKTTVGGDVGISTENEAESSIVINSHHPIIPSKRTDSQRPEHPAWMDHPISSKGATGNCDGCCDGFIQRDPTPRPHLIAALRLEAPQKPGQSCQTLFMQVERRC